MADLNIINTKQAQFARGGVVVHTQFGNELAIRVNSKNVIIVGNNVILGK